MAREFQSSQDYEVLTQNKQNQNCPLSIFIMLGISIIKKLKTKVRGVICKLLWVLQKYNLWLTLRDDRNRQFRQCLIKTEKLKVFQKETRGGEESRLTTQKCVCDTKHRWVEPLCEQCPCLDVASGLLSSPAARDL